jgi:hypothetical protein
MGSIDADCYSRSYRMGLTTADELALDMLTDWQSLKGTRYTQRKFWSKLIGEGQLALICDDGGNTDQRWITVLMLAFHTSS